MLWKVRQAGRVGFIQLNLDTKKTVQSREIHDQLRLPNSSETRLGYFISSRRVDTECGSETKTKILIQTVWFRIEVVFREIYYLSIVRLPGHLNSCTTF